MKNKIILTLALTAASVSYAQVGVNTTTPKSTFDITAKNPTGIARNADGLLIPRVDRARAQLMQNVETSTMIYVNNLNGNAIGTTKNIDAVGFYYFDGIYWVKMVVDPSAFKDNDNNIYNTDGTLAANRTVTQNDKKLNFITTSENGFSVTSATAPVLTVSGNTNRVGIGYATPIGTLAVSNSSAQADNVIVAGYNKDTGDARNVVLYNSRTTNANFGGIEFVPGDKGDGLSGASIRGIDRDFSNGYGGLQFHTRNSKDFAPRMTIKSSGNIGIGTDAPTNLLHVNSATSGAVKIVDGTQGANKVLTSDANGVATWKDIPAQSFTDTSIYAGNGTIAGTNTTRTVAQATNNLAFTSTATTGTSHFSVDGSTLSVDAVTNRVGIGTTAPNSTLQVVGGEMRVGGSASQAGTIDNPILRIHSKANAAGLGGQIRFNENDTNYGYYIKHNTATGDQGFDGLAIGSSQPGKYTENISRPGLFVADNQNVGVGTASPQTILHIDSNFDNNVNAAPSTAQQINDVVITRTSGNVGIGTTNPSTKLEVNGNLKVNDTKELTSSTISPLYVDQNGLVGKAPVVGSQVAHFRGDALDAPPGSVTLSNINQSIPTPLVLQPNHRFINTMGADVINGNIKITRSGYYQFGGMINFYLASSVNEYYWILINVQKSSDNGSTWKNINGIRAIINGAANGTYSYSQIIPQTIEQFNSGDLVRIVIYRTNLGGQPQGNEIRKLHVISSVPGAIYGYTFSMSKL